MQTYILTGYLLNGVISDIEIDLLSNLGVLVDAGLLMGLSRSFMAFSNFCLTVASLRTK